MCELKKKISGIKIIARVVIWLSVGILLAVAIQNFIHGRQLALRNGCLDHLGQIDVAKNQWVLDHKKATNDIPTWIDLKPYVAGGDVEILKCPEGGTYTIGKVCEPPTCSLGTTVTPAHVLP